MKLSLQDTIYDNDIIYIEGNLFTNKEVLTITKEQLAIDCNCSPDDFDRKENVITSPGFCVNRRKFLDKPFFFKMTTMGGNAVISADERLHDWLREFATDKPGHWLFEHTSLREIDNQLSAYNKQLFQTHHMFLPMGNSIPQKLNIQIKWFEQDEIQQFYQGKVFPNALTEKYNPDRPDVLAVAAMDGASIIGMAGCSADTPLLWQIGIDVHEAYRGKGIGTYLVSLLKDEIIARGKIPYYGTSLSNLGSWKIALHCGFTPSWIDTETIEW